VEEKAARASERAIGSGEEKQIDVVGRSSPHIHYAGCLSC